jgi:hopanoid biosynthesis associated RND transporter like protein HpnN
VQRLAPWIVLFWLATAAGGAWYTARFARVNTDTAAMLSSELPFRQSYQRYRTLFPYEVDALLAVVEAPTPEQADAAATSLAAELRDEPALFSQVDVPAADPYFARNALLFLGESQLASLAERLIDAEPLIGLLASDPSLRGFAQTLIPTLRATGNDTSIEATPLLHELTRATEAELRAQPYTVSWQRLFAGDDHTTNAPARSFVLIKPVLDWNDVLAAEAPIAAIRSAVTHLNLEATPGVRVRITGDAALAYEEIRGALAGSRLSVLLALVAIAVILRWTLGSTWMTAASMLTLVTGLILTAAFATAAVGELHLLSFAAAVLYLGLGVDYAIHFCLRYREALGRDTRAAALRVAATDVRRPLLLCAAATATGFYAFLPTDFAGVAQLGLICGTGMFINLAVTLSLLPALLMLLPVPPAACRPLQASLPDEWLRRHARPVCAAGLALAFGALLLLPRVAFDRNPMHLRDAASESVATLLSLRGDPWQPMTNITVLAADERSANHQAEALRRLPVVREVMTAADLQPQVSARKLGTVDELSVFLGPALAVRPPPVPAPVHGEKWAALEQLRDELARHAAGTPQRATSLDALTSLLQRFDQDDPRAIAVLASLEHRLLDTLPHTLQRLRRALQPDASTSELPEAVRRRWIAADGSQRLAVYPKAALDDNDALRRFVESVQTIAPDATDEPVLNLRSGDAVVRAFQVAVMIAATLILALLLIVLRSFTKTALALTPLVLAGLLTAASLGMAGVAFNFANVIAVPLLLGANVDNGIHMVHRYYTGSGQGAPILSTSTARAVTFSGLANLCGFANLLASPHPGTASMGLVLTIGMAWTLLTTLIVVPAALMAMTDRGTA